MFNIPEFTLTVPVNLSLLIAVELISNSPLPALLNVPSPTNVTIFSPIC